MVITRPSSFEFNICAWWQIVLYPGYSCCCQTCPDFSWFAQFSRPFHPIGDHLVDGFLFLCSLWSAHASKQRRKMLSIVWHHNERIAELSDNFLTGERNGNRRCLQFYRSNYWPPHQVFNCQRNIFVPIFVTGKCRTLSRETISENPRAGSTPKLLARTMSPASWHKQHYLT